VKDDGDRQEAKATDASHGRRLHPALGRNSERTEQRGMNGPCQSCREGHCRASPKIGPLGGGEDAGGSSDVARMSWGRTSRNGAWLHRRRTRASRTESKGENGTAVPWSFQVVNWTSMGERSRQPWDNEGLKRTVWRNNKRQACCGVTRSGPWDTRIGDPDGQVSSR